MDKFNKRELARAQTTSMSVAVGARSALAIAVALLAMPVSQQVAAQAGVLEEVIVTAQKREESNQEVPISITAFGADAIWWSFPVGSGCSLALALLYYRFGRWRTLHMIEEERPPAGEPPDTGLGMPRQRAMITDREA